MKSDSGRQSGAEGELALAQTLASSEDVLRDLERSRQEEDQTGARSAVTTAPMRKRANTDVPIGTLFGNFEIVRKLGVGGMGVVYEAMHRTIGRRAAVKVMHREFARSPGYATRFLNEARAVNIIQHPGLVEIFEHGQQPDGTLFIVMEFLRGESLEQRMSKRGQRLPAPEVIDIAQQLARALTAAHQAGVIHRDLKPENIMLVEDPIRPGHDWVKILDFGIAKLGEDLQLQTQERTSERGAVIGTPMYMAPEQFGRAEESDGRTDVFSLGVVLFELLTGSLPYEKTSLHLTESFPDQVKQRLQSVDRSLAALIERMLSKEASDRPSMLEVSRELGRQSDDRVTQGSPPAASGLRFPSHRLARFAGLVGVFVMLGAALIFFGRKPPAETIQHRATKQLDTSLGKSELARQLGALSAMGQSHDTRLRARIEPHVQSPNPELAAAASLALGQIRAVESQTLLLTRIHETSSPIVKLALSESLARLGHPEGIRQLTLLTESPSIEPDLRIMAATRLLEFGNLSGRRLLWDGLSQGTVSEMTRVATLGALAMSFDAQARSQLQTVLSSPSSRTARLFAAFHLAKLGDLTARKLLVEESAQGPMKMLAAQLLASLGDTRGRAEFLSASQSKEQPEAVRMLALLGLAECGDDEVLGALDSLLMSPDASDALREVAAGVVLRILWERHSNLSEQSLLWAQAALGSSSSVTRELAVAALGEMGSDDAIPPLARALHDGAKEVRSGAALALGRKRVRTALIALREALADQDVEVRESTLRAIQRVLSSLRSQGDKTAESLVLPQLSQVVKTGSETEQIAASAILFQLGDDTQRARLMAALHATQPLVRRLAIEFAPIDDAALERALTDEDRGVRFTAAKRLLERGSRQGITVLQDVAKVADVMGLIAYNRLRGVGVAIALPDGIPQLLSSPSLTVRLDVLDEVAQMSPERATGLLILGSRDLAAAVRHRVAEIAKGMYIQSGFIPLQSLLAQLGRDSDPLVRADAVIPKLSQGVVPREAPVELVDVAIPATQSDSPRPSVSVPVSTDPVPPQATEHPLRDEKMASPDKLVLRLLREGTDALAAKQLDHAKTCFEKLRTMERHGGIARVYSPQVALGLAMLYESQRDLTRALQEYSRVRTMRESSPQQRKEVDQAMSRLAFSVGHLIVHRNRGGGKPGCVRDDLYLVPGLHLIDVGSGQTESVRVEAGTSATLMKCSSAAK